MIKKISEGLIRRSVSDKKQMKALSLAFAVKAIYLSSQINDASYSKIAAMFGISRTSAKERIETLKDMHLVLYNDKHLIFKYLFSILACRSYLLLYLFDGLRTHLLNLTSHRFYELEIKCGIDNSSLSLPLLSFTKYHPLTHSSYHRHLKGLELLISIEMLFGIEVLDKIMV